jgi:ATP-dependent Zn protease
MNKVIKTALISAVAFFAASGFLLWQNDQRAPLISHSRFVSQVADGQIRSVAIAGNVAYVWDTKGGFSRVIVPSDQSALIADLQRHGVAVGIREPTGHSWLTWLVRLESKLRFGS